MRGKSIDEWSEREKERESGIGFLNNGITAPGVNVCFAKRFYI